MLRSLLGLLLLTALVLPGAARASGWDVILDCRDELLSKTYTQAEYDEALATFPSDGREYSGCYEIILDAKRAAAREAARPDPAPARHHRTGEGGGERSRGASGAATGEPGNGSGPSAPAPAPAAPVAGGSVSAPYVAPTAADADALAGAARRGAHRLRIGGVALVPGLPAGTTSGLADYPAPVLLLLGALAAAALLGLLGLLALVQRRRPVSGRRSSPSA